MVAYRLKLTASVSGQGQEFSTPHFVAIAGYELQSDSIDDQSVIVYVFDPLFSPEKGYSSMSYEVFQTNYKCHGGKLNFDGIPLTETGCEVTNSYSTAPIQNT